MDRIDLLMVKGKLKVPVKEQSEEVEEKYTNEFLDVDKMKSWLSGFSDDEYDKVVESTNIVTLPLYTVTVTKKKEPKEWKTITHKEYCIGDKKYLLTIQEK